MKRIIILTVIFLGFIANISAFENKINVAILVYEGIYLLDFDGPMEVFNDASNIDTTLGLNVFTFSPDGKPCKAHTGLSIIPTYSISNCPKPDILIIPGGDLNISINNIELKKWLLEKVPESKLTLSVCTGAFILAKIGLLDNMKATTWHGAIKMLGKISPKINTITGVRFTDNEKLVTTAGISAGIDGSLFVLQKLFGKEIASKTAQYMDYDYWDGSKEK
jgi:transcriptional regulator GlxA family with amidase domain